MIKDCLCINLWSLLIRLPDDAELRVLDGSNYDEVVYEGKHGDMEIPLKYYRDYYVEMLCPAKTSMIYLRKAFE